MRLLTICYLLNHFGLFCSLSCFWPLASIRNSVVSNHLSPEWSTIGRIIWGLEDLNSLLWCASLCSSLDYQWSLKVVFTFSNLWTFMQHPECLCYGAFSSKPLQFVGSLELRKCIIALNLWLDSESIGTGIVVGLLLHLPSWFLSSCSISLNILLLHMEVIIVTPNGEKCLDLWSLCHQCAGFQVNIYYLLFLKTISREGLVIQNCGNLILVFIFQFKKN